MNQTHASAPFITNDKKVQRAFLMEIVSDKLMNKNDIQHFEIEAFNLVTSSCQSLNYNMDIMSVTFNDQTFSLAGGILIISFTIEGKSTNIGDSDNDEPEQNIVKCFETNYNNLQNNVNTATGFFDGIDIEKVEGTKFPTMIVSIIGGCCFFVLAAIFLVDRNLRRKRRTSKKDKTCRNDKNTSNKNEKEQPKRMLMRKVDAHDDLERNISIYDPDSSYKMIGCAKPSSRLEVDTHSRHMPISESPRDLQEIVIQTLTPLAQDYDSSSLDDRYGPNYRDEKRLYSSRAHQLNSTTADRSFSEDSHKSANIDLIMQNLHSIMDDVNSIMVQDKQHTTLETSAKPINPMNNTDSQTITTIEKEHEHFGLTVSSFALNQIISTESSSEESRQDHEEMNTPTHIGSGDRFLHDCTGNSWLKMIDNIAGRATDDKEDSFDLQSNERSNSSGQSRFSARLQQMEV